MVKLLTNLQLTMMTTTRGSNFFLPKLTPNLLPLYHPSLIFMRGHKDDQEENAGKDIDLSNVK